MSPRVGIIGDGGIAQAFKRRIEVKDWKVAWMGGTGLGPIRSRLREVDIVAVAISTRDNGEAARDYILDAVRWGKPVVTCEKGSWANHPKALWPHRTLIGCNAACGGGSELLRFLRKQGVARKYGSVEVVLNASIQFLLSMIGNGYSVEEAFQRARELFLLEPGSLNPLACIQGELRDAALKTCLAWNTEFAQNESEFVTPQELGIPQLTEAEFAELVKNAARYRYVVTFTNYESGLSPQRSLGEFRKTIGKWHIKGGFQYMPPGSEWISDGPMNGVHFIDGSGRNPTHFGVGAGHGPTSAVMLNDAYRLLYG